MSRWPAAIVDYLDAHHVMTLATQSGQGPWAAAVFFAHDADGLIFLSSPKTRHCQDLLADPRCAATIQQDYRDWPQIQGLQLSGTVRELTGEAATAARRRYAEKFPVAGPLAVVPAALREALARVHWYRLDPAHAYFIDNRRGFGHRAEIPLAPPTSTGSALAKERPPDAGRGA